MSAKKRGSKINVYITKAVSPRVEVSVSLDGGEFETIASLLVEGEKNICLPLPKDSYQSIKIKVSGWGEAQIEYISHSFSVGGNG